MRKPLLLVPALLMFAAGVARAENVDPATIPILRFDVVSDGLYRGARPDAAGLQALADAGVTTVLDLEDDDAAVDNERAVADGLGLTFISKPMSGFWAPDDGEVNDILALLADSSNRPLFVHCQHGQDRTGLLIALDRVFNEGWSPADAHAEMMAHGFHKILWFLHHYYEEKTGFED
jgi:protein tyrosine/serine phosphatase